MSAEKLTEAEVERRLRRVVEAHRRAYSDREVIAALAPLPGLIAELRATTQDGEAT